MHIPLSRGTSCTSRWISHPFSLWHTHVHAAERPSTTTKGQSEPPVEGGDGTESQQQVEQGLGRAGQRVVLLGKASQAAEPLPGQDIHHNAVPDSIASQEALCKEAHHPGDKVPCTHSTLAYPLSIHLAIFLRWINNGWFNGGWLGGSEVSTMTSFSTSRSVCVFVD